WGLPRSLTPAGGIASSIRDQLAYARFHLGDGRAAGGKRLLSRKNLKLMHSDLAVAGNFADAVGVSWLIEDVGGVRTVAHGGNVSNLQLSSLRLAPAEGFAITVLTNATKGGRLHDEIEAWAFERHLGVRRSPPAPKPVAPGELAE